MRSDAALFDFDAADRSLGGRTTNAGFEPAGSGASGTLTGSTDDDAFGAVRVHIGSTLPLGFTGELTDPTTGFLDLRARSRSEPWPLPVTGYGQPQRAGHAKLQPVCLCRE
jgi:hypothetical protein